MGTEIVAFRLVGGTGYDTQLSPRVRRKGRASI
jgi:hypothetical protein